jgi:phosphoglycerate dehydrogenase-like enzyme
MNTRPTATKPRLNALFIVGDGLFEKVYGPDERRDLAARVHLLAPPCNAATITTCPELLRQADIILSSWGMATMDAPFLAAAPRLQAVFYGAGTVKGFVTDAFWRSGIVLCSAWGANAVPVSEFTLAAILFSLKRIFATNLAVRQAGAYPARPPVAGAYGSTVGLISLGMIGRLVRERLRPFDLRVLVYDPFLTAEEAVALGVTPASLPELFRTADVVSLHAPWLKETEGLITGAMLDTMKPGATFINTARGAIVREAEMIDVLQRRVDLTAVLDVTHPEPPLLGSPLYTLSNVFLTPHIAGSTDNECRRMGRYMIDELDRYLAGQPLKWQVTEAQAALLA